VKELDEILAAFNKVVADIISAFNIVWDMIELAVNTVVTETVAACNPPVTIMDDAVAGPPDIILAADRDTVAESDPDFTASADNDVVVTGPAFTNPAVNTFITCAVFVVSDPPTATAAAVIVPTDENEPLVKPPVALTQLL